MDKERIIDEIVDFVTQYTEIMNLKIHVSENEVDINIEIINSDFNYVDVARMLSKILKARYIDYRFIVNMIPSTSKVLPLLKEYGIKSELMKNLHKFSFDEALKSFFIKNENNNLKTSFIFFNKPFKAPEIAGDFVSEEEACNDYIDFLNEAYLFSKDKDFIEHPDVIESMIRFNLFKLYGSKLFRMGTLFLVKLWRFNYDIILKNSFIEFSENIKDKIKFSNFLNGLSLNTYADSYILQFLDKDEIKYFSIDVNIFTEMIIGAASYLEAVATSKVQKLILLNPARFYSYFLKRFVGLYPKDKVIIPYFLTLAGGVVIDNLKFDNIKDSTLGKFKIDRSEAKVKDENNVTLYAKALRHAYHQIANKKRKW